jgi:hypothetical protein
MNYASEEDGRAGRIAIGIVLALAVAAGGWWWWDKRDQSTPEQVAIMPEPAPVEQPADETPPAIQHPLGPLPAEQAPMVDTPPVDADTATRQALAEVLGPAIADWLVDEQLARRVVATIDNLPRNTRIESLRPLRPPAEPFAVEREVIDATVGEERITLSPANFARYDAIVGLLAGVDVKAAAAVYRRIYPRLQTVYEELGYPGRYFNDRVVQVIDHLLAAPEPEGPLRLEQPKVLYRFADERLEALSPGQKLLVRIGPRHARVVKQKLAEFRAQIATGSAANEE